MGKKSLPPGAMVRVGVDNIAEGDFKKKLDASIRRAVKQLYEYQRDTMDGGGKSVVTATITIAKAKGTDRQMAITTSVKVNIPTPVNISSAKMTDNGDLLCQPVGTSEYDPDQQTIFDNNGKIIGADTEDGAVAGRIEKTA